MRADRLISLLLLLQQRKKITASELAEELNVSIRTIYRDMVVLSANGFPVFAEKGPGGGCCIIEDFKSSIRTLSDAEVDSLKMMRIPEGLISLSVGQDLQRALLKVIALIPERKKDSPILFIDWAPWAKNESDMPSEKVHQLYEVCARRNLVFIKFTLLNKGVVKQIVQPYGITAKSGDWYLVYKLQENFRYKNIGALKVIQVLDETFIKDENFDLEKTWKRITIDESANPFPYTVRVKIRVDQMELFENSKHDIPFVVRSKVDPDGAGWVDCEIAFEHLIPARGKLLSCGNAVKVVSPEPLRLSMLDYARQALAVNGEKE